MATRQLAQLIASITQMSLTIRTLEAPKGHVQKKRRSVATVKPDPTRPRPTTRSITGSLPIRSLAPTVTSDALAMQHIRATTNPEATITGKKRARTPTASEIAWEMQNENDCLHDCIVVLGSETDGVGVAEETDADKEAMWERAEVLFEDDYGFARTSPASRSPPPTPTTNSLSSPRSTFTTPRLFDRDIYSPSWSSLQAVTRRFYRSDRMDLDALNPVLDHIHERIDHTCAGIHHVHKRVDEVEYNSRDLAAKLAALERRMEQEEKIVERLGNKSVMQEYEIREVHRQVGENKDMIEDGFGLKRRSNARLW